LAPLLVIMDDKENSHRIEALIDKGLAGEKLAEILMAGAFLSLLM